MALLESRLTERVHLLSADTPEGNLSALIDEERLLSGGPGSDPSARADADALPAIAEEPFRQAILGASSLHFRKFAEEMLSIDISTEQGKRDAVDLGFASKSNIVQRLLCYGEQKIARRHWALAKLHDSRSAIGAHFTFGLSVDPALGTVPGRLQRSYAFTGLAGEHTLLLNALLRAKLLGTDFYNAATGIYALKAAKKGSKYDHIPEADFWCRPQCVTDFCEFLHLLMVARGWADTVNSGFTFKTWGEFYNPFLMRCLDMRTRDEQYNWLERATTQFAAFLRLVEVTITSVTVQSVPTEGDRGAIAPIDCQPAETLRLAVKTLDEYVENADMFGWVGVGASASVIDAEKLPRLSDRAKPPPFQKLTPAERKAKAAAEAAKRAADREVKAGEGAGIEPGSTKHTAFWLTPKKSSKPLLVVSGKVWDVKAFCAKYGITVDTKCLEVILCARVGKNKMGNCPSHTSSGHKSATDAAHTLSGFDYATDSSAFARDLTKEERTKYLAHVDRAGNGANGGLKGGGGGRGRGGGRGGGRSNGRAGALRGGAGAVSQPPRCVPVPSLIAAPPTRSTLTQPLRTLLASLPGYVGIDNPGQGNCGPYAIGIAVGCSHVVIRALAVAVAECHAALMTRIDSPSSQGAPTCVEDAIVASLAQWIDSPAAAEFRGMPPTVEIWATLISRAGTFFDDAALLVLAMALNHTVVVHPVRSDGSIAPPVIFAPNASPFGIIGLGCELGVHFVTLARSAPSVVAPSTSSHVHVTSFESDDSRRKVGQALRRSRPLAAAVKRSRTHFRDWEHTSRPVKRMSSLDLIFSLYADCCSTAPSAHTEDIEVVSEEGGMRTCNLARSVLDVDLTVDADDIDDHSTPLAAALAASSAEAAARDEDIQLQAAIEDSVLTASSEDAAALLHCEMPADIDDHSTQLAAALAASSAEAAAHDEDIQLQAAIEDSVLTASTEDATALPHCEMLAVEDSLLSATAAQAAAQHHDQQLQTAVMDSVISFSAAAAESPSYDLDRWVPLGHIDLPIPPAIATGMRKRRAPTLYIVYSQASTSSRLYHMCSTGSLRAMAHLAEYFSDPFNITLTLETEQGCWGGLLLRPRAGADRTCYILASYTHTSRRRQGVQRILILAAMKDLQPYRMVRQANNADGEERVSVNRKLGFEVTPSARAFVLSAEGRAVQHPVLQDADDAADLGSCVAMELVRRPTSASADSPPPSPPPDRHSNDFGDDTSQNDDSSRPAKPSMPTAPTTDATSTRNGDADGSGSSPSAATSVLGSRVQPAAATGYEPTGCPACQQNRTIDMCIHHPPRCPAFECALECGRAQRCTCNACKAVRFSSPVVSAVYDYEVAPAPRTAPDERRTVLAEAQLGPPPSTEQLRALELSTFEWPLRSVAEVVRLLACPLAAPTDIVGFEFSAAMRSALEAEGRVALSVDLRESDRGGMHACLDVRLVLPLRTWERAYLFPPCFQQLRADEDCLAFKMADGRAFWGCLLVIFCLCADANLLIVEQPDTIVVDFFGYDCVELRTSAFGDNISKFARLGVRNVSVQPPVGHSLARHPSAKPLPVTAYADPEERDRAKSSWAPFPHLCAYLASRGPLSPHSPRPSYAQAVSEFANAWHEAGNPVPSGYLDPTATPPTPDAVAYQHVRGAGDGRVLKAVIPMTPSYLLTLEGQAEDLHECHSTCSSPSTSRSPSPTVCLRGGGTPQRQPLERNGPHSDPSALDADAQIPTLDIRAAGDTAVILVIISVLLQPLVFAHANGFTVLGLALPTRVSRAICLRVAQSWVNRATDADHHSYLVGEYRDAARLAVAPLDFAPSPSSVCRSSTDRRRRLASGAAFIWCTLAALGGTPVGDAAARAFLAAEAFIKPVQQLADFAAAGSDPAVAFRFGMSPATSVVRRPRLTNDNGAPSWRALAADVAGGQQLLAALRKASDDPLLHGWEDRIRPYDAADAPPELLVNLRDFSDPRLSDVAFSPVYTPLRTAWVPLPPLQPAPPSGAPLCISSPLDMLAPSALKLLNNWLSDTLTDLVFIRDSLAAGGAPDSLERRRPSPLVIGQGALHPWARGIVWDCRPACCIPLDFGVPIETHLNLDYLRRRLTDYPDQYLVSNLLEGVRLDADVELHTVLIPHLTSLPLGFASVGKELRRLHGLGWYDFFATFPFWPMYLNGQGATARKLEPDRFRRTTEGGGPRHNVFDELGVRALSINEASHLPHMPRHFVADKRPEFVHWLAARGLPRDLTSEPLGSRANEQATSKYPKEVKPTLAQVMRDLTILRHAADVLNEPIYVFGDDAKDYFNQLAISNCDLPKLGIVFLANPGELPGSTDENQLLFVSERRLGFGTHGASNIAQRFSEALLFMFRQDMDEADTIPAIWRRRRLYAQQMSSTPCFDLRSKNVCPQERLYSIYMYTDDPVVIVVGVQRTLLALRVWRRLTNEVGLIMAIPDKRTLGTWATWLGIIIVASLGIVVVPKEKLVRASVVIERLLCDGVEFHTYRSLCGLLEFLRAVNLSGRNVMHGLYRPHGQDGVSRFGPSALVTCDVLMSKQLQRWRLLIARSAGASVKSVLERRELETAPSLFIAICGDACFGDSDPSGLGGFCQGTFWHFLVPECDFDVLSTPILEFLAACFNILTFAHELAGLLQAEETHVVLRTDALTTALTLPFETQRSTALVEAFQWLRERPEWTVLAPKLQVAQLFGDCNPFSDRISRSRWTSFRRLCVQHNLRPNQIALPDSCRQLYRHVVQTLRSRREPLRAGARRLADRLHVAQPLLSPRSPSPVQPRTAPSRLLHRMSVFTPMPPHRETKAAPPPATPRSSVPLSAHRSSPYQLPSARSRSIYGLRVPTLPGRNRRSALSLASQHYAHARAASMASGGEPNMQLTTSLDAISGSLSAVEDVADFGINANTAKIDERAWVMWEQVCERLGTSALRTNADARDYPQRNTHLLAVLLLHAFVSGTPRDPTRAFIKPRSALAYPLAIIRVFARWGVQMPGYKALVAEVNGLMRLYLAYHGPGSLAPRRAEPMRWATVVKIMSIPLDGRRIGGYPWHDGHRRVFVMRRLVRFLWRTAFRIGEIARHASGEIYFLTRSSLTWRINNIIYANKHVPTRMQLLNMTVGVDGVSVTPPRSKPDQWGEIHCPFTIFLVLTADPNDACAALRDIELEIPCLDEERDIFPLFPDADNQPLTHGVLDPMLKSVLTYLYSAAVAALFTWHSFRSGLATALHAAGVSAAVIMLMCRWMNEKSLHVYRRIGSTEQERHFRHATAANVDAIQAANVVTVVGDQGYASFLADLNNTRGGAEARRAFDAARDRDHVATPRASSMHVAARSNAPLANQPMPNLQPLTQHNAVGRRVLVARSLWPKDACDEHNGMGWEASVLRTSAITAVVRFSFARTRDGRPYQDERVPLAELTPL